jgi:hypothetical protein
MPGKPFQSKLEPFYEFIREGRSKRWSYQKIADVLTHEKGLPVSANAVFSFVKVRAKRRRLYALPPLDTPPSFPSPPARRVSFSHRGRPRNPMKPSKDPITSETKHRLVVPIQTRGNLGKSTEAIARCEWMSQRGVSWKGRDLDAFNRTLSTTYAGTVDFIEPGQEPEGELIKIFRRITEAEVTVIDPSAHMNRTILRAIQMVRLPELCAVVAARVTVLVYPVDEVSDMDDIAHTFETLADSVDWVIVRNPVKIPTTKFFQGSELEAQLMDCGAARLEIPALLSDTRNHLRSREIQIGRGLSPAEALKNEAVQLDMAHRIVLEQWLADLFSRFDAIAGHLIPTAKANVLKPAALQPSLPKRRTSGVNMENIW